MTLDPSQTAPVNGGDSQASCPSLDDMVEQLASDAARGEFDKKAKDKLLEAAKGAAKALQDYKRDYDAHKARWVVQNGKIEDLAVGSRNAFPTGGAFWRPRSASW